MLKKVAMLLCVFGAAAVLTGCSSLQTASVADFNKQDVVASGTAVEHIAVATHGLYLLWIPLITGSTDNPGSMVFLQDTVTVKNAIQMLTAKSNELKASGTYNIVTKNSTNPWFFGVKEIRVSANAVK